MRPDKLVFLLGNDQFNHGFNGLFKKWKLGFGEGIYREDNF